MLSSAVMSARFCQFISAMALMGLPLFFLYGFPAAGACPKRTEMLGRLLLIIFSAALGVSAVVSLMAQAAVMTDTPSDAFAPEMLWSVVEDTGFGHAMTVRLIATMFAIGIVLRASPSRASWALLSVSGTVAVASFAWTGHGVADEGTLGLLHLGSDVLHLLAAAAWFGALLAFTLLFYQSHIALASDEIKTIHAALHGFSGVGTWLVGVLLATGLANSLLLVGPSPVDQLAQSPYGLLLSIKVILFAMMLGLAAANRFVHTPRLAREIDNRTATLAAFSTLRRSITWEMILGVVVVAIVAILGTLEPPAGGN
jgi:putative copper resistance protein D